MNQPKYVKGKDGKFAGSIGTGKNAVPTTKPVTQPKVTVPEKPVDDRYEKMELAETTRDPKILNYLSQHPDPWVRATAMANPAVNVCELYDCSTDPSPIVRAAVARNPECPEGALVWLVQDHDSEDVRLAAAGNPNLETDVAEWIAWQGRDDRVKEALCDNPQLASVVVETLAADENKQVVLAALRHPNCPEHTLDAFAEPGTVDLHDVEITRAVAGNENAPKSALGVLLASRDEETLVEVLDNPNADKEIRDEAEFRLGEIFEYEEGLEWDY